jgi:DNA-binding FadR family transcriptional regulator
MATTNLFSTIAKVSRRSAAEDVRDQIAALIDNGQLKVDERLPSELDLARTFGVSRPVVREALVSLQALGLVTSQSGRGSFVASRRVRAPLLLGKFSPRHLNEVRGYLEIQSARLAAERRSDEQVGRLAGLLARMEDCDDAEERNRYDAEFHISIAEASGNPILVKLVEDLRKILEEHGRAAAAAPNRRPRAAAEHRKIYEAIVRRDTEGAALAMRNHLEAADRSFATLERDASAPRKQPA